MTDTRAVSLVIGNIMIGFTCIAIQRGEKKVKIFSIFLFTLNIHNHLIKKCKQIKRLDQCQFA